MKGYVYFIQAKDAVGLIKIGSASNVAKRVETLATGCPYPIVVLTAIEFPSRLHASHFERNSHFVFRFCRKHGEWFSASQPLRGFIEDLKQGTSPKIALARAVVTTKKQVIKFKVAQTIRAKKFAERKQGVRPL